MLTPSMRCIFSVLSHYIWGTLWQQHLFLFFLLPLWDLLQLAEVPPFSWAISFFQHWAILLARQSFQRRWYEAFENRDKQSKSIAVDLPWVIHASTSCHSLRRSRLRSCPRTEIYFANQIKLNWITKKYLRRLDSNPRPWALAYNYSRDKVAR